MRTSVLLVGWLWLSGLGLGMLLPPPAPAPDDVAEAPAPAMTHPGHTLDLLAYRLTGREAAAASQAAVESRTVVAAAAPPRRPPPPDIADVFRRDVSAVLQGAAGPVLVVVDPDGSGARRVLRTGDAYRDGWSVAGVEDQSVTLRRREEIRRVDLYSPYLAALAAADAEATVAAPTDPALERLRRKSLPRRAARGDSP